MPIFRSKIFWSILALVVFAVAFYYGFEIWWLRKYGSSPQPVPSAILDVDKNFNHFPSGFPPDPGDAGKKTIQGVDADHDGVRDDVQRWIYAFVPNEPKKQIALRQMARYFQQSALADDYSSDVIKQSSEPLDRAVQCSYRTFTDEIHGYMEEMYLKAKVLNTYSRVKRYWDNDAKIRPMDVAGDHPRYDSPCDDH